MDGCMREDRESYEVKQETGNNDVRFLDRRPARRDARIGTGPRPLVKSWPPPDWQSMIHGLEAPKHLTRAEGAHNAPQPLVKWLAVRDPGESSSDHGGRDEASQKMATHGRLSCCRRYWCNT